jgi:hypothetical protein
LPVAGPLDVIGDSGAGALDDDLGVAITRALKIPRDRCVAHARRFDWQASIDQFAGHLAPIRGSNIPSPPLGAERQGVVGDSTAA